ncbi:MAG: tetratricopeptide repeat protein [Chitinivibrionia bacterium]|nr:tetratricopeptide repeat protein [Chitinivibrionia bacterium]
MRNKILVLAICVCATAVLSSRTPAFAGKADELIAAAENFIASEQYHLALKRAREATEQYPDNAGGWMILARCQSLLGHYLSSNLAYERALSADADPAAVYRETARNYMQLRNWHAARAGYLKVLEEDGDDIETLLQLGLLEATLGETEEAVSRYEKALGPLEKLAVRDSANADVHRNLGVARYHLGRKAEAVEAFETAARLGGGLAGLYGPLADCLQSSGQPGKALACIREGLREGSQQAWLYSIWGKILEDQNDYEGAIARFSQAAALGEEPWSEYARKQIARQQELKQRKEMLAKQSSAM